MRSRIEFWDSGLAEPGHMAWGKFPPRTFKRHMHGHRAKAPHSSTFESQLPAVSCYDTYPNRVSVRRPFTFQFYSDQLIRLWRINYPNFSNIAHIDPFQMNVGLCSASTSSYSSGCIMPTAPQLREPIPVDHIVHTREISPGRSTRNLLVNDPVHGNCWM